MRAYITCVVIAYNIIRNCQNVNYLPYLPNRKAFSITPKLEAVSRIFLMIDHSGFDLWSIVIVATCYS